jgi:multiple sugar transport system substrate-binding protein
MEMTRKLYSRRDVTKLGLAAAVGLSAPLIGGRRANASDAKLIFWLQPNFNKVADDLLVELTMDYEREKGLAEGDILIEKVPGGEVAKRMAAALEVGAPPDVTRANEEDLTKWGNDGHLLDVAPLVEEMKAQKGGINEGSLPLAQIKGEILGVPMGIAASVAHVRADKFREAGYDGLPPTWDEFVEFSKKVTKPPFYAYGMALGLAPSDSLADVMSVVRAYGGAMVNSDNRPALDSKETVEAFKLINSMYNVDNIIPRGAVSWDNSGNNKAFQSGQIAYALNPTSIYSSLINDNSPFLNDTILERTPGGPAGRFSTASTDYYSVFKKSANPELAMGLIQHFTKPENYSRFIVDAGGRYLPIYTAQLDDPFWSEKPAFAGLKEAARTAQSFYAPGRLTPALSEIVNRSLIVEEVQNMLIKGKSPEQAVADAHKAMVDTFKRAGEPT